MFFIFFLSFLIFFSFFFFFFLMIRRPPRSTLFPTRRSSDLGETAQFRRATAQSVVGEAACPLDDEQLSLAQHIAESRLPIENETPLAANRSEAPLATSRRQRQARIINALEADAKR